MQVSSGSGERWIAQYDYTAADNDEVSFVENDVIINVEVVDEGWMTVNNFDTELCAV